MDITSLHFLFLFLPIFVIFYLIAKKELRLLLITIANVVFLMCGERNTILWPVLILFISYFLGNSLSQEKGKRKAVWLWAGAGINLAVLSLFKIYTVYGPEFIANTAIPNLLKQPFGSLGAATLAGRDLNNYPFKRRSSSTRLREMSIFA